MENKKALKLIDKILEDLEKSGIVVDSLTESLKELREFALQEQIPLVVKVLRLTYEHLANNDSFLIPIPDDEPIEEGESAPKEAVNPTESISYMLSLIKDLKNKMNLSDLKDYRTALMEF